MFFNRDNRGPDDFGSYDEYKEFIEIKKQVVEKENLIKEIEQTSKNEEEFSTRMEEAGFVRIEGSSEKVCGKSWCQEHGECLDMTLFYIQELFNIYCFEGMLRIEDYIIKEDYEGGCVLPSAWYKKGRLENKTIEFLIDIEDYLSFENTLKVDFEELCENKIVQKFIRAVYMFSFYHLRKSKVIHYEEYKNTIQDFLSVNKVLKRQESRILLKQFEEILVM